MLITLALDALQWTLFLGFGLVELRPVEGGVPARVGLGVLSLLQYVAALFVLEEVTFRMLDTHLHEADRGRGLGSAVFVSAAWGLWHLPIAGELTWQAVGLLLYVHVPYGVCLSVFWRRTGNLLIPVLCHALCSCSACACHAAPNTAPSTTIAPMRKNHVISVKTTPMVP